MAPRTLEEQIYNRLFRKPKQDDPRDFEEFVVGTLVPEIRSETRTFHGHNNSIETRYPGLDYTNKTHRIRLERYDAHRRLFRVFDKLNLSPYHINCVARWEGTKFQKEEYEAENGVIIHNTEADDIPTWEEVEAGREAADQEAAEAGSEKKQPAAATPEADGPEEEDDGALESVGDALNERLRAQVARRNAGETTAVLDPEWETWFKTALENNLLEGLTLSWAAGEGSMLRVPANLFPQNMLSLARNGQWEEIPHILHDSVRQVLESPATEERSAASVPQEARPLTRDPFTRWLSLQERYGQRLRSGGSGQQLESARRRAEGNGRPVGTPRQGGAAPPETSNSRPRESTARSRFRESLASTDYGIAESLSELWNSRPVTTQSS